MMNKKVHNSKTFNTIALWILLFKVTHFHVGVVVESITTEDRLSNTIEETLKLKRAQLYNFSSNVEKNVGRYSPTSGFPIPSNDKSSNNGRQRAPGINLRPPKINFSKDPQLFTEGKIVDSNERENGTGTFDLCQFCHCKNDQSDIVCLHSHHEGEKNHEIHLKRGMIPAKTKVLRFIDCDKIRISSETFQDPESQVQQITFQNIKNLALETHSLMFSENSTRRRTVLITLENTIIPSLPERCITQGTRERHGNMYQKHSNSISIHFKRTRIELMESGALSRARVLRLEIEDSKIFQMETKSIDLDVYELSKFRGNDLPSLPEKAICLHSKTTVFKENTFRTISNQSILIETENQVLFEHNNIGSLHSGALLGVKPMAGKYGASIVFANNIIEQAEPHSMKLDPLFEHHEYTILNNSFQIKCECNITPIFKTLLGTSKNDASFAIIFRSSRCLNNVLDKFLIIDKYLGKECAPFPVVTVVAVGVAAILLIIAVAVCVICSYRIQKVKEEANMLGDCVSQSFSTLSKYNDPYRDQTAFSDQAAPYAVVPWGLTEVKTYHLNETPEFTEQTESIVGTQRSSAQSKFDSTYNITSQNRFSCPFN